MAGGPCFGQNKLDLVAWLPGCLVAWLPGCLDSSCRWRPDGVHYLDWRLLFWLERCRIRTISTLLQGLIEIFQSVVVSCLLLRFQDACAVWKWKASKPCVDTTISEPTSVAVSKDKPRCRFLTVSSDSLGNSCLCPTTRYH